MPEPEPAALVTEAPVLSSVETPAEERGRNEPTVISLEDSSSGRFAQSEAAVVDGEDLDVPTFLRRKG